MLWQPESALTASAAAPSRRACRVKKRAVHPLPGAQNIGQLYPISPSQRESRFALESGQPSRARRAKNQPYTGSRLSLAGNAGLALVCSAAIVQTGVVEIQRISGFGNPFG